MPKSNPLQMLIDISDKTDHNHEPPCPSTHHYFPHPNFPAIVSNNPETFQTLQFLFEVVYLPFKTPANQSNGVDTVVLLNPSESLIISSVSQNLIFPPSNR